MAIPNSSYSEALSAAIANYSNDLADNISNNNALLSFLKKSGNINTFDGGTEILQNISYPGTSPSGWYTGAETLDVSPSDTLSTANFAIKQAYGAVTFTGLDEMIHSGKSKMHDFFKAKISNAEKGLQNLVSTALFYSNTENSGKSIGGLQHLVSDTGTGTVGGIDASAQTWWKNYVYDFSTNSVTPTKDTILAALDDVIMNTTFGAEMPDIAVGGKTYFGYVRAALSDKQRFVDSNKADSGFLSYRHDGVSVIFDPACADARMYVLNTNYLHWRPHVKKNFVVGDSRDSVNQDAYVIPLLFGGNMTVSGRKYQGVIVA